MDIDLNLDFLIDEVRYPMPGSLRSELSTRSGIPLKLDTGVIVRSYMEKER